ncbi:MAG: DUF952 domain-containing protein [Anaerolineales bacterium]
MIVHITSKIAWESAQDEGSYRGDTLESEGFIHCSRLEQVLGVANDRFPGEEGLVLLCIAEERASAEIRYEDCYETGEAFPHIYGPLNRDAVVRVVDFPPRADGTFTLPPALTGGSYAT